MDLRAWPRFQRSGVKRQVLARFMLWLGLILSGNHSWAAWQINMPRGVTPISHQIYDLHMWVFWICVVIATLVFVMLFYIIFAYRKRPGMGIIPFHDSVWIETLWTLVPLGLVVMMIIPTVKVMFAMDDASRSALNIKVTGVQWKWKYDYLDYEVSLWSNPTTTPAQIRGEQPKTANYLREVDEPLVLPVHEKVRLLFTANDVMHSWWVPALGVKKDCIPGYVNEAWVRIDKPGVYYGQCTELCGMQHGYMPIVVIAKSKEDFAKWLLDRQRLQAK